VPQGLSTPLILSGGLNAENVGAGIRQIRPWSVDVSSGVEVAKGIKHHPAMQLFCQAVRCTDQLLST
jgi:phosphoribosylanthranilate isomerase